MIRRVVSFKINDVIDCTIKKYPNISRSNGNQTMKFAQLIKYSMRNNFPQNNAENKAVRLVQDLFSRIKRAFKIK